MEPATTLALPDHRSLFENRLFTMINKLVSITDVGKFANYKSQGNLEFCKVTLIYGGNGHGKTTLCDIFRSLQSNDPGYITGRETLGGAGLPAVVLKLDGKLISFKNGAWDGNCKDILIYDTTFINENVFSGEVVTHDHKKRLHRVIIGEAGVIFAQEVELLDEKIKLANRDLAATKTVVEAFCANGTTAEQFVGLPKNDSVDETLRVKSLELSALEQAGRIRAYATLKEIALPVLPDGFHNLLSLDLADISKDAEIRVKNHLATHATDDGEGWIVDGIGLIAFESCPFCGQSLDGVSLLASYQDYFGESYKTLKQAIRLMRDRVDTQIFGDSHIVHIDKLIAANNTACELWSHYIPVTSPGFPLADAISAVNTLKTVALRYLDEKSGSPLEIILPGTDFDEASSGFSAVSEHVEIYNIAVREINTLLSIKQGEIDAGDVVSVRTAIAHLNVVKRRYSAEGIAACDDLKLAQDRKRVLGEEKDKSKTNLNSHTTTVFAKYQERINELLVMFNAGFRIADTKSRYVGGAPSSTYAIVINGKFVELGDHNSRPEQACFRNTLSAGDKSTLALSFFLAHTEQDSLLSQKIVIFDDPFTSQDRSRRSCTQQMISSIVKSCKQVIVLSHDPNFLRLVWDATQQGGPKTLQLTRWFAQGSTITEWDIKEATKGEYFEWYSAIFKYYHEGTGDKRQVAQSIRLLLEQYLRLKVPNEFPEGKWLGELLERIRDCDALSLLFHAKQCLPDLEAINDFSKRYHHATNPSADSEPINDGELQGYAKRTLEFIGSF